MSGATSNAVKTLVREGALFIGLISYMFYLNWKLTLLLLITAPFIAIIVNIAGRRLRKLAKSIQTAMGDVTHIASEAVEVIQKLNHLMQKPMKKIDSKRQIPQTEIKI